MCGIYCSILVNGFDIPKSCNSLNNELKCSLARRGPDEEGSAQAGNIFFMGFVLWQQGRDICKQPIEQNDLILLFNGDVFNISKNKSTDIADTAWIANILERCESDGEIGSFFKTLEGPFSIIFYNKRTQNLYFARDSMGRNSLIIEKDDFHIRILSTTCVPEDGVVKQGIELPPLGLFKLNLSCPENIVIYPWVYPTEQWYNLSKQIESTLQKTLTIRDPIEPPWLYFDKQEATYDFYDMAKTTYSSIDELFNQMLQNVFLRKDLETFSKLIEHSVKERVTITPKYCANCVKHATGDCHHSKVAILFSGGIDCTILAILANKFVDDRDSIDLINVAFEGIKPNTCSWDVPDRCSAKASLMDLYKICPKRKWNFIEVNVKRAEFNSEMENHVKHLIYPLNTVLDESIGSAFWFASRGQGLCNELPHTSTSRVVIVGSGADELFGGYTRHRNAYRRCDGTHEEKLASVLSELQRDWERIPSRNLGRDDRVIADHGKTSRAPFIEENVVNFIQNRTSSQRCCYLLEDGLGDKLFLRLYGFKLGISFAVNLKKRAIQFGSRVANKKQNANDISSFLQLDNGRK